MNKIRFYVSCLLMSAVALTASVHAVDMDLVNRYLNAANDQYSAGNYVKAFTYINTVLSSYKEEALPQNVEVLSETIYYGYLEQIKNSRDTAAFNRVKEKLIEFPYISSERINRIIKIINTYEAQDVAWGSDPTRPVVSQAAEGNNNPILRNTLELQLALEALKRETQEAEAERNDEHQENLLRTQREAYERALTEAREISGEGSKFVIFGLLLLGAVVFIVFVVVLINLVMNMRSVKTQNEKFMETLKAVAEMSRAPQYGAPALDALPPLYGANGEMRLIGSAMKETGLPPPPATEAEKKELADLAAKCREIGVQIDRVTGRKNNSKNVAEMVFKLAQEMGVAQYEATLFFAVAMVYDIGFLEIDEALLQADNLTDAQKYEIRNHVKQGLAQLSFVPEKYVAVFADGVLMHHENMDGSGYPEGLEGSRIPFIARLIHVAESFNALISKRNYRDIFDKETALNELRKKDGMYDPDVLNVLEHII